MVATCMRLRRDERQESVITDGPAEAGRYIVLHAVVLRPATAFRRHPGDDLIGIHDVARLAVHAVRGVDLQARWLSGLTDDLVDIRRTESRARMAVLGAAARAAHFGLHDEM